MSKRTCRASHIVHCTCASAAKLKIAHKQPWIDHKHSENKTKHKFKLTKTVHKTQNVEHSCYEDAPSISPTSFNVNYALQSTAFVPSVTFARFSGTK